MKKTIAVVVALLFVLGFTSFTFASDSKHKAAKESIEITRGKVVSVDTANKTIVVTDNKTQTNKTFTVSDKAIAVVKTGDEVKVKVKGGITSVKIIKSEEKNEKEEIGEKTEPKGNK